MIRVLIPCSYILNRGWIDRSQKRLPTYNEITFSGKGKERAADDSDANEEGNDGDGQDYAQTVDEDEFDDVVDNFESSYNFRFEEPYVLKLHLTITYSYHILTGVRQLLLDTPVILLHLFDGKILPVRKLERSGKPERKKSC